MKKRLGILALAATLIVQSAAFVPTFAEDTAAEPTAAEETVLARYKSSDTINIWTGWSSPWAPYARIWNGDWKNLGGGNIVGYSEENPYKGVMSSKGFNSSVGWARPDAWRCLILKNGVQDSDVPDSKVPFMSKSVMSAGAYSNMYKLAKGFTAPEGGIIKIGSDYDWDKEGDDNIIAGVGVNHGSYISIVSSNGTTLMEPIEMKLNSGIDNMKEVTVSGETHLEYTYSSYYRITKGETLYFFIGNSDGNVDFSNSVINWNPVVEYVAYQPEYSEITYDRNGVSFKVTNDPGITEENIYVLYYDENNDEHKVEVINFENKDGYITFDFAEKLQGGISYDIVIDKSISVAGIYMTVGNNYEGLTVDAANNVFEPVRYKDKDGNDRWVNDNVWGAYYRVWGSESSLMKSEIPFWSGTPSVGIQGKNVYLANMMSIDKTAWVDATNGDFIPFVGAKIMSCGAGTYGNQGYSVSKGFTAPYSGNVKIEQNNLLDATVKNEIWSSSGDQEGGNGLKIRITKNTKDNVVMDYVNLDKTNGGRYEFTPFEIYVNKGDVLYFEVTTKNDGWTGQWKSLVHWNPVVTYTDVAINAAFIDSSGNALTTVANLLAADGAQLKMSAFDAAEDVAGTPIIVFCDENDALVKTVIGNTVNLEAVLGNTAVQLGDLTGVNAKSVKVMLWSADGTLKPLTGVFGALN